VSFSVYTAWMGCTGTVNAAHRDRRRSRAPGRRIRAAAGSVLVAGAPVRDHGLTYLLEMPVGGLGILGWILIRNRRQAA
jgi:hypothetical protein